MYLLTHSLAHSFTHLFIYSSICSCIHTSSEVCCGDDRNSLLVEMNPLLIVDVANSSSDVSEDGPSVHALGVKINGSPPNAARVDEVAETTRSAGKGWRKFQQGLELRRRRLAERLAAGEWWRSRRRRRYGDTSGSNLAAESPLQRKDNNRFDIKSFPDDVALSRVVSVELGADKTTAYCAPTDIELQDIVADPFDDKQQTAEETPKSSTRQRCADCCRQFFAFLFSTVGSVCLMIGYVVLGGLIFRGLEYENEIRTRTDMRLMRMDHVRWLWNLTMAMNVLHPDNWSSEANRVIDSYTKHVSLYIILFLFVISNTAILLLSKSVLQWKIAHIFYPHLFTTKSRIDTVTWFIIFFS